MPIYIVIATPTDYDTEQIILIRVLLRRLLDALEHNSKALIIIKSTVPVGFTELVKNKFLQSALFSPSSA